MSITTSERNILLTPEEQRSAAARITALDRPETGFRTSEGLRLSPELDAVIAQVLRAIESGNPISISTLPREVTTTTAASMLGVTRPTLMKYIRDGKIAAHKVGSHHRLLSHDVLVLRDRLKEQKRDAVFQLMDVEAELESQQKNEI